MHKKKIIYITPHLSTGGLPQYLYKKIELLKDDLEIFCIEYNNISDIYTIQKNKIKSILDLDHFFSLDENKNRLLELINLINPDYIHMEELPEYFCNTNIATTIYNKNRKYKLFETSHDTHFDVSKKKFFPDKFIFVSKYQQEKFKSLNIPSEIVEYPVELKIPNKIESQIKLQLNPSLKHIINIGLFTPGKNQSEIFQYAEKLKNKEIHFHFIGNQADNFKFYWKELMNNIPDNCTIWGERNDVDVFYQAADLFLFTSKNETSPLVVKESLSWNLPILMYDLPSYLGMYNDYDKIKFLNDNLEDNINTILNTLYEK